MSAYEGATREAKPSWFERIFRPTLHWQRLAAGLANTMRRAREMQMLLTADDRMLKDVGLTRSDAKAVAHCSQMARAAAMRREDAMASAFLRRAIRR